MEDPLPINQKMFKLIHGDNQLLKQAKILIVGVGGIGCQILKVLSKMPIGTIHIIDMDTIQLSNLNRQFLFKKEHKGMSKSLVAKDTILKINPDLDIVAHHKNIKELPINFFKQFNFLIMALDNIQARNYVNKIGVRLNIPIIDAGTLGYKGNVTTIIPNETKCYSCEPKSTQQKQFPVCTIRMRPEKPIHCIVWAKLFFEVLFGPQNDDNDLKDLAELAKKNDILEIMSKLFESDILEIKNAKEESDNKLSEIFAKSIKIISKDEISQHISIRLIQSFNKHDEKVSYKQNISIFAESFERLMKQKSQQSVIAFQKDDDNIIHFISSAANLRMYCFSIQNQSFNQIKNMAGNIVPAIASTNSIVSGIQIVEMMKLVKKQTEKMKSYYIQNLNSKVIGLKLEKGLPQCQICHLSAVPVIVSVNLSKYKLDNLVQIIKQKAPQLEEFSINYGSKQIYNSDDPKETLLEKSILELCSAFQVDFVITNQDTMKKLCVIWLIHDQELQNPTIQHEQRLNAKIQEEEVNEKQKLDSNQNNDDSDIVLFDDDASPEIQILQVRKKPQQTQNKETVSEVLQIVEEHNEKVHQEQKQIHLAPVIEVNQQSIPVEQVITDEKQPSLINQKLIEIKTHQSVEQNVLDSKINENTLIEKPIQLEENQNNVQTENHHPQKRQHQCLEDIENSQSIKKKVKHNEE